MDINLYTGNLTYWKGKWTKDASGNNFIDVDEDAMEFHSYEFKSVPAKSVDQLVFILSKRIQEEKNLSYPVHIDWREIKSKIIGEIPESSERFDNLASMH